MELAKGLYERRHRLEPCVAATSTGVLSTDGGALKTLAAVLYLLAARTEHRDAEDLGGEERLQDRNARCA